MKDTAADAGTDAPTPNSTATEPPPPPPPHAEDPLAKLMAVDEEGLTFANKTAQWIAYERHLESQMQDRLFFDPLAEHLAGKYGKTLSDLFASHAPHSFPGLGEQGFRRYHAARTKLISERIGEWSSTIGSDSPKQVLNLGAGYDTRAFWDTSLAGVGVYIEVDEPQVNGPKEAILQRLEGLPELVCPRRCVSLDFSKETAKDVSKHGFSASVPTLWILEGLIMYLEKEAVRGLYEDVAALSCEGSYAMINVVQHSREHHRAEFADSILLSKGWTKVSRVMFGDPGFAFGRYPKDVAPNESLGFAFYHKASA